MPKMSYGRIKAMEILCKRYHTYVDPKKTDDELWDEVRKGNKQRKSESGKVMVNAKRVKKIVNAKKQVENETKSLRAQTVDRLKKVIDIKAKRRLGDYVQRHRNGERVEKEIDFMHIRDRTKNDLEELVGEKLNAETHSLHINELIHIENNHNGKGDRISNHDMKDIEDYEKIVDVLNDYDGKPTFSRTKNGEIDYSNAHKDKYGKNAPKVEFRKRIGEDVRIVVVTVCNNSKKRIKTLTSYIDRLKGKSK